MSDGPLSPQPHTGLKPRATPTKCFQHDERAHGQQAVHHRVHRAQPRRGFVVVAWGFNPRTGDGAGNECYK